MASWARGRSLVQCWTALEVMEKKWTRRIAAVFGIATRGEVLRKLKRMWPDSQQQERAKKDLDRYGTEAHEGERARVQLAILKLSDHSLDRLAELTQVAKQDYQSVLMWAETPEESRVIPAVPSSAEQRKRMAELRKRDRRQYVQWREE